MNNHYPYDNDNDNDDDMGIFNDYQGPDKPFLRRVKDWFIRNTDSFKYRFIYFIYRITKREI